MNTYGRYPIDVIGQHIYLGANDVERWFEQYINWYVDVARRREPSGVNKPIAMTEYGWDYNRELGGAEADEQERANAEALRIAQGIMTRHTAIQSACYFNLSDSPAEPFGLCHADLTRRRAFRTFVES
jgi:hypothetical protein